VRNGNRLAIDEQAHSHVCRVTAILPSNAHE
jgi:hypothetical protein